MTEATGAAGSDTNLDGAWRVAIARRRPYGSPGGAGIVNIRPRSLVCVRARADHLRRSKQGVVQ